MNHEAGQSFSHVAGAQFGKCKTAHGLEAACTRQPSSMDLLVVVLGWPAAVDLSHHFSCERSLWLC
jgi:hypothetical protein